jgi:hypothetical protein
VNIKSESSINRVNMLQNETKDGKKCIALYETLGGKFEKLPTYCQEALVYINY